MAVPSLLRVFSRQYLQLVRRRDRRRDRHYCYCFFLTSSYTLHKLMFMGLFTVLEILQAR